jgi:hypothetical protein
MTKIQRDAIDSPTTGLMIFQTNSTPGFYYYDGSAWKAVSAKGSNTTLSNLVSPTAINQSLNPATAGTLDCGTSVLPWRNIYFKTGLYTSYGRVFTADANNNTAVGLGTLNSNSGTYNTATGLYSLFSNTTGPYNTANGCYSLFYNTTGLYNTAHGSYALFYNTTGASNTANGVNALYLNTTGHSNVAVGIGALYSNVSGSNLVAVGDSALFSQDVDGTNEYANTAIGSKALYTNTTGYNNTANGYWALYSNTIGDRNTANGMEALFSNTNGNGNTAYGYHSLYSNTSGTENVASGLLALAQNTSGHENTAYGDETLFDNITGNYNTALGYFANVTSGNLSNAMALGSSTIVNASNKVAVGSTGVTVIGGQVGWSTFSDGRFKTNIKENVPGLAFINKLKAVTYNLQVKKLDKFLGKRDSLINSFQADYAVIEKKVHTGFVAQDVEKAAQELNYDFDGVNHPQNDKDNYALVYADFVPSLVKAVQELSAKNDALEARLQKLETLLSNHVANSPEQSSLNNQQLLTGSAARLEQNTPNPFNRSTVIKYYMSSGFHSAELVVTDLNGRSLKTFEIKNAGYGQQTIAGNELASGLYQYSLIIDGRAIDSKKMELLR